MNTQKSKVALVTGASKGLGYEIALALHKQGYTLIPVARDAAALAALKTVIEADQGQAHPLSVDLTQPEARRAIADKVREIGHLDVLVHNAGMGYYKPFPEHSESEHEQILQLNLNSLVHLTHQLLPILQKQGSGHILAIGSDLSQTPLANMSVYAASKFGMRGFLLSLAREVRSSGIKVSLIHPGIIDTHFNNASPAPGEERGGRESLNPGELAALVVQVLQQPGYQLVDEVTVHPQFQDY